MLGRCRRRREGLTAEVSADVRGGGLTGGGRVGGGQVCLRLGRDAVGAVLRSGDGGRAEPCESRARADADVAGNHRRTGVRGCRAGQDSEAGGRAEVDGDGGLRWRWGPNGQNKAKCRERCSEHAKNRGCHGRARLPSRHRSPASAAPARGIGPCAAELEEPVKAVQNRRNAPPTGPVGNGLARCRDVVLAAGLAPWLPHDLETRRLLNAVRDPGRAPDLRFSWGE